MDPASLAVGVAPPFPFLEAVGRAIEGTPVELVAQDCHSEPKGAFTSAVSAPMLASLGVHRVIVGHSERRQHFGDDDAVVHAKLLADGAWPADVTIEVRGTNVKEALAGLVDKIASAADHDDDDLAALGKASAFEDKGSKFYAQLAEACERRGRSEAEISRSMLLFARLDPDRASALAAFRRLNPWFRSIPDAELGPALILGEAPRCRARIAELAEELRIDHPVLDLSGLDGQAARRLLEVLGPGE